MTQHTPGPWESQADAHGRGRIHAGGAWVATTWLATGDGNDAHHLPALANARLIAAAPELMEALKEMLANPAGDYDTTDDYEKACKKARAAIAKATGGAA